MNWAKNLKTPLLGFAAYSGSGKTTLLRKLIPILIKHNIRAATIKHAHHEFDIDKPGKDSYELRQSGTDQVLIASRNRWALMTEMKTELEPDLPYLVTRLDQSKIQLILVEGFKHEAIQKIEITRGKRPELYLRDDNVIAVISDQEWQLEKDLPQFEINNVEGITEFVMDFIRSY